MSEKKEYWVSRKLVLQQTIRVAAEYSEQAEDIAWATDDNAWETSDSYVLRESIDSEEVSE
jgi:hypothetical protein